MNRETSTGGWTADHVFLFAGALFGGLGVALGAFGAHGLRARIDPATLATFETAVRYQLYHALGLLAVSLLYLRTSRSRWLSASGWLFIAGTVVFSGSLYLLVLTGIQWLGAITPVGGAALIAGWGFLALAAVADARGP